MKEAQAFKARGYMIKVTWDAINCGIQKSPQEFQQAA